MAFVNSFKEVFDNPINFFRKKRDLHYGLVLMAIALFVFVALNQLMIYFGLVIYQLDVDPMTAIMINYGTLLAGYFVVTTACIVPFKLIGGKKISDLYALVAYSLVPLMFLWIPHIIPQTIVIVLSALLMTRGSAVYAKTTNKRALLVPAVFIALVIVLSLVVRNYLLPLLYFV